jgi:hypothetical protein
MSAIKLPRPFMTKASIIPANNNINFRSNLTEYKIAIVKENPVKINERD